MIFWILTPVPPPHLGCVWGGGVRGSKLLCVLWPLFVYLDLGPEEVFLFHMDPLTHGGGPGSQLPVPPVAPPPPPYGPLLVRTLPLSRWVGCLVTPENVSEFDFL